MSFSLIFMVTKLVTKFLHDIITIDNQVCLEVSFANDYKNCSFVISDKHLKLQWIKGLERLSFKPFFLICGNFATRLQNY